MKKKVIGLGITFLLFIFTIFLLSSTSFAGTQTMDNLTYEVTLDEYGNADVVETWEIYVSSTNTLFKTFELDEDKYSGITNVVVTEVSSSGIETELTKTDTYAYHVTKGYYYALETRFR